MSSIDYERMFTAKEWKIHQLSPMYKFDEAAASDYAASLQARLKSIFPNAFCETKVPTFYPRGTSFLYMWAMDSIQEEDEAGRPIGPAPQTVLEAVFSLNTLISTNDIARAEGRETEEPNRLKLVKLPVDPARSPSILLLRGTSTAAQDAFRDWLKTQFDCFVKVRQLAPMELHDLARALVLRSLEINTTGTQTPSLKRALQRPVELTLTIPETMGIAGVKTIHVSFTRAELVALVEDISRAFDAMPGNRSSGDSNSSSGSPSDERLGTTIIKMLLSHVSNMLKIDLSLLNLTKIATPVGVASLGGNFRILRNFNDLFLYLHQVIAPSS